VEEVKRHGFFEALNWDDIFHKRVVPEWRPVNRSETDLNSFDREFTQERPARSAEEPTAIADQDPFQDFTCQNTSFIPPGSPP
jgi:hypothetical protein